MRLCQIRPREAWEPRAVHLALASVPPDLRGFIEAGDRALDHTQAAIDYVTTESGSPGGVRGETVVQPLSQVMLHRPQVAGSRMACLGGNYADHMAAFRTARGDPTTTEEAYARVRAPGTPSGFWNVSNDAGPESDIIYPARTQYFDFEGEGAIVLGKPTLDMKAAQLRDYVWGVTLVFDWSIRDADFTPTPLELFAVFKNFDTGSSLGPVICVGEVDPEDFPIETRLNGELRQRFNTRDMIFSFGEGLEYLTRDLTLAPGDVLSGGTGLGTAIDMTPTLPDGSMSKELFLKVGDELELSSPDVGTLRNRIVAKRT